MSVSRTRDAQTQLRAVFGSRVPANADDALKMIEASPMAPAGAAAKGALKQATLEALGKDLDPLPQSADAFKALTTNGSAKVSHAAGPDGLRKVISLDEAQALFKQLATNPDIPHGFIDEGCHYRAHVEGKLLEEAGVYSEKAFLVPDGGDLRINSDEHPLGFTLAMFHTAPVVYVEVSKGVVERRIIDPSLFGGPVPEATWVSSMRGLNDKPCNLLLLPRFASHLMDRDDPPDAWRPDDLKDAREWGKVYKEVQRDMEQSGFYDSLKELVAEAEKR